ncbi:TIGR00180 family glycosyltransferase [Aliiglaciecola sp.]|nr:TIGR00180 family glycosyltransferase [Aliiglaciecola sp.]
MAAEYPLGAELSNLFTIVTLSYERKIFLERYFIACQQNRFNTIVLDGSQKAFYGKIPDNVDYYHYPKTGPIERLKLGFEKVKTPFALLLADDDFVVPSALMKAVKFLSENPTYHSIQGKVLTFNELYKKSDILVRSYNGFDKATPLNSESQSRRLQEHLSDYVFTIYSLQKTEIWRNCLEKVYADLKDHALLDCNCPAIFELTQSIHCVLSGKNKNLNETFLIRESVPRPQHEKVEGHLYFNETSEFDAFIRALSKSLVTTLKLEGKVDWYGLLKNSFSDFAAFRRKNTFSSIFTNLGSMTNFFGLENDKSSEIKQIKDIVISYRSSVLRMLFSDGLKHVDYWYDDIWRKNIVNRFKVLSQEYNDYVIFGAGEHTAQLLQNVVVGEELKGISDSNSSLWGSNILGKHCCPPSEILNYSSNVIISSQHYEREIEEHLVALLGSEINVLTLYEQYYIQEVRK